MYDLIKSTMSLSCRFSITITTMLERDGPKKIGSVERSIFWGVVLALLAVMWLVGAYNPSPDENYLLFALLGIFATVGSGFCFFPKISERFWKTIGISLNWLFWISVAGLLGAAIISFIAGAPIPAAIIIGSIIIAGAINQSQQ